MELAAYTELIKQMPFRDQAFETQKATWTPFAHVPPFDQFFLEIFSANSTISISRENLFTMAKSDPFKAVFATILWGYPRGYTRGNNMAKSFPLFVKQAENLRHLLSTKASIKSDELVSTLKQSVGVGLSTLSKLLYFFGVEIEGWRCLIMDTRIIKVLASEKFTELQPLSGVREHNKEQYYTAYLKTCAQLSANNGYTPDQLELFLFMFGNNLKQGNMSDCEPRLSKSL